jgi:thiol-disulfide isomerase/thioredoxin
MSNRVLLVWLLGVALIGVGVYALAARGSGSPGTQVDSSSSFYGRPVFVASSQRRPAPPVAGQLLSGGSRSIAALRGKVVVLNSWASWCAACRHELPALERFASAADATNVAVLGIDVSDDKARAISMAREFGLGYPSLFDPSGSILVSLGAFVPPSKVPSTIVLDRAGLVAATVIGPVDGPALAAAVHRIAAES